MHYIICNTNQRTFFTELMALGGKKGEIDIEFIFDTDKLQAVFLRPQSERGLILVEASLNWNHQNEDNFFGFNIAANLRRVYSVRNPIVFFSILSKEYFEKLGETDKKYKLLYGRGSHFLQYPCSPETIRKSFADTAPLGIATLHDVVTMLCDLKGLVYDRLNHELKYQTDANSVKKIIDSITPYLSEYQKKLIEIDGYSIKLQDCILKKREDLFYPLKQQFLLLCLMHLTDSGERQADNSGSQHTILIIDDRNDDLQKMEMALSKEYSIKMTDSGIEAIEILKADVSNRIIAIISDWRLYKDDSLTYWQPLQGYEILEFAAKNGIRALFALTSQADYVVHHLRNLLGIRFAMFKKDNLRSADQWGLFRDVLNEACIEAMKSRADILDDSAVWNETWKQKGVIQKTLRQQYIDLWNSVDRERALTKINNQVEEIWEYLTTEKDPNFVKAQFEHITVSKRVLNLFEVMVLRRIWMALWFNYLPNGKLNEKSTSELANFVYTRIFGKPGEGSVNQKTNNLCLKLSNIGGRMFPEEREWLIKKQLL